MNVEPNDANGGRNRGRDTLLDLARQLTDYERQERLRLRLPLREPAQWIEPVYDQFNREDREQTTLLLFGLTRNHDLLIGAAVRSLGYRVRVLEVPDNEAHVLGKAFCDRGMCNPTYFTVGHLLQFLRKLRDEDGLSPEEIVRRYVLIAPNGCGPCRYTLYVNEYRKALRESGFEGFRVLLFNQRLIEKQTGADAGIQIDGRLMFHLVRAIIVADVLNLLSFRTRPYELEPGATDAAIARSRERLEAALERNKGLLAALWQVRRDMDQVAVDRTRIKPKVGIIGEIWAQTTEGDGNYRLREFLEAEGAEVETQTLIAWILLLQWELVHDASLRAGLQDSRVPLRTVSPLGTWRALIVILVLVGVIRFTVRLFAWLTGLRDLRIPSMRGFARRSHDYYDVTMRGGEMFSEVAKLLDYAQKGSAHLVVSVKPFGCMPSSAVSDGVQSLVGERCPQVLFLPVETTGDSAVNVYSRLQMQLFRARNLAQREAASALTRTGIEARQVRDYLRRHRTLAGALHRSPHRVACTAANLFLEVGRRPYWHLRRWRRWLVSRWAWGSRSGSGRGGA